MTNHFEKYVYIDTKIVGAIHQTVQYFKSGIFGNDVCILIKKYRVSSVRISQILKKNKINYYWIRNNRQLDALNSGVVFYLFNAQSNCRLVSNRKLIHIFVTHGESNKAASTKPIIRLYDFISVAGQAGIDRYLNAGIFSPFDIKSNRLIKMGDTFTGRIEKFNTSKENGKWLFYAPTWEGGIEKENYSSLYIDNIIQKILEITKSNNINGIAIQAHPNIGHRSFTAILKLAKIITAFLKADIKIQMIEPKGKVGKISLIFQTNSKFKIIKRDQLPNISLAITDISAMEIQCIASKIPVAMTMTSAHYSDITSAEIKSHYDKCWLKDNKSINKFEFWQKNIGYKNFIRNYYIGYECDDLENMSMTKRINWLINFANENLHTARFLSSTQNPS
ncbi:hypothetical protein LQR31_00840 [Chromobacterium vaccinii]|uniref:hypothetical protein n=1 Tax=Chromobacterium vaccinii TaxID=1108595 RepID=UPI001E3AF96C|nr:hypothetical protein [Chromobacterium vaccinii]MCD4483023.1 hypothetical protein [Chromobacterium vaccinii]